MYWNKETRTSTINDHNRDTICCWFLSKAIIKLNLRNDHMIQCGKDRIIFFFVYWSPSAGTFPNRFQTARFMPKSIKINDKKAFLSVQRFVSTQNSSFLRFAEQGKRGKNRRSIFAQSSFRKERQKVKHSGDTSIMLYFWNYFGVLIGVIIQSVHSNRYLRGETPVGVWEGKQKWESGGTFAYAGKERWTVLFCCKKVLADHWADSVHINREKMRSYFLYARKVCHSKCAQKKVIFTLQPKTTKTFSGREQYIAAFIWITAAKRNEIKRINLKAI